MEHLPAGFVARVRAWLGAEAPLFLDSLTQPPCQGLRVNTLKLDPKEWAALSPFALEPVPWCPEGFRVTGPPQARPGRHPYHAAGLYYLQDASAMAAVALLDPQPGELVLDACAAPGGKATHIAARLQHRGLLVVNEVLRPRTRALIDNLELFGAIYWLLLSQPLHVLARVWPDQFDRVLVDAPCSGEGLFRRDAAARREWSPAAVEGCAARQDGLLAAAADLVRPGGRLVYATCTFEPEENEAVVARFLRARPDFELAAPPVLPGFSPGRPDLIAPQLGRGLPLEHCVRIWPHLAPGEGHFIAVMARQGEAPPLAWATPRDNLPGEAARLLAEFWETTFTQRPPPGSWQLRQHDLYWWPPLPAGWQPPPWARIGWHVGRLARGAFIPAHALALAMPAAYARQPLALTAGAPELERYLQGESRRAEGPDGWLLVTVDGFALGWVKRVQGVLKNHYPHQLRWR